VNFIKATKNTETGESQRRKEEKKKHRSRAGKSVL
jgi:hypothetical protein